LVADSPHIVLLGDSIFDNAAYTRGEPDVVSHLRQVLPASWRATLAAVDGASVRDLAAQARRVPSGATHLAVSIGGNDALANSDLLRTQVVSTAEALNLFAERLAVFEEAYRAAIARVVELKRDTMLCTIYNGNLAGSEARIARVALTTFNDVILRVGLDYGLTILELRTICMDPADYANPIEPSGRGGLKIARAIAQGCGAVAGPLAIARIVGGVSAKRPLFR
jgi:hypothetical protein